MLPEALIMKRLGCLAAFERIAGSPFLNCFIVSLLKKIQLFNYQINIHTKRKIILYKKLTAIILATTHTVILKKIACPL